MIKGSIRVACAIIEEGDRVLVAQRSETMAMPLKWEFPGGKLHEGESAEECLVREVREELGVRVAICRSLPTVFHRYDEFAIELIPFVGRIAAGVICLHEHRAVAWVMPGELAGLDMPDADRPVVASYLVSIR